MATAKRNNEPPLSLKGLLDLEKWHKIQDNFSAVTGVDLRTVDLDGRLVIPPSGQYPLCRLMLKGPSNKDNCSVCLPTFLGGEEEVDKNLGFICRAGLHSSVAPLRLPTGKALGYLIAGPVTLVMRKPKEEYRASAENLNIDLEEFWNALLEIKVMSFQGINSVVGLIQDVGEYTLNLAYQQALTDKAQAVSSKENLNAPAKVKQLMDVLLDVVFEVSGADIGSIMFLDKDRKELTIHASKGIPEEIVSKTRVMLGEGISGIAAKEAKAFLINETNLSDNRISRIRPYLNRPYISSSMVLPLKLDNEVMGVMNLGALKTSSVRFDSDNLNLVNRLVDLTAVALRS